MNVDLRRRERLDEVMDQPGLAPSLHHHALAALRRINWISRSSATSWEAVEAAVQMLRFERALATDGAPNSPRTCRVLDIACGGGDVAIALARRAIRAGYCVVGPEDRSEDNLEANAEAAQAAREAATGEHGAPRLQITGIDVSPVAIEYARQAARRAGFPQLQFQQQDVFASPLPECEAAVCSLFLHHLETAQAAELLRRMKQAARCVVGVNDLRRTRIGYLLASVGGRLLTRSPVVHVDGPLSVRAAFTPAELAELAEQAGLGGACIRRRWPQRMSMLWRRS